MKNPIDEKSPEEISKIYSHSQNKALRGSLYLNSQLIKSDMAIRPKASHIIPHRIVSKTTIQCHHIENYLPKPLKTPLARVTRNGLLLNRDNQDILYQLQDLFCDMTVMILLNNRRGQIPRDVRHIAGDADTRIMMSQ